MATIRKQESTRAGTVFQAMVRQKGHSLSRIFRTEKDAKRWAADVEAAIRLDSPTIPFDREQWLPKTPAKTKRTLELLGDATERPNAHWTMSRVLDYYWDEVGQHKASPEQEKSRTRKLSQTLGDVKLCNLKQRDVQRHVDERLKTVGAASARLEVMHIRAVWKHAQAEPPHGWGLVLEQKHPCQVIKLPPAEPPRDRRLEDEDQESGQQAEEAAVRAKLAIGLDGPEMVDLFDLALETGMRQGEILKIRREEIKKAGNIWTVVKAKHKMAKRGHVRKIVLTTRAHEILMRRMRELADRSELFNLNSQDARTRFRKACKLAKVTNLRFHDLRHEGISRMADRGLTIGELQAQSGHRTAQMLMRYVNARGKDIAAKLG